MRRTIPALGMLALAALPIAAVEQVLTLDPAETSVSFHLGATGHDVEGAFQLLDGEIRFDTDTGAAQGQIHIDAAHAETGNKKRDKAMHKKVLESDKYPTFLFRAERIEGSLADSGSGELQLHGILSIHGSDHPLTLPALIEVDGDRLKATMSFSIPYVDWGMKDPSWLMLRVAKEVEVTIAAEGRLFTEKQANPR